MDGDVTDMRELWLASGTPDDAPAPRRLAGRRTDLAAVRRHLESGSGLLLVTGEAGIGKTALVTAACEGSAVAVPTGHCLPLATEVPLLPVVDLLRCCLDVDAGRWQAAVLAELPAHVMSTLAALLPELDDAASPVASSGRPVSTAVAALVAAVAGHRPLGLLVEDLHWADPATLDALEHLVAVGLPVPVVATVRTDDPTAAPGPAAWSARIRRHAGTRTLELGPLNQDETRDQLTLLLSRPRRRPLWTGSSPARWVTRSSPSSSPTTTATGCRPCCATSSTRGQQECRVPPSRWPAPWPWPSDP